MKPISASERHQGDITDPRFHDFSTSKSRWPEKILLVSELGKHLIYLTRFSRFWKWYRLGDSGYFANPRQPWQLVCVSNRIEPNRIESIPVQSSWTNLGERMTFARSEKKFRELKRAAGSIPTALAVIPNFHLLQVACKYRSTQFNSITLNSTGIKNRVCPVQSVKAIPTR